MTPVDALRLALLKEQEAMEAYQRYAEDFPGVREIFEFLVSEEYKHKELIERKINELTEQGGII